MMLTMMIMRMIMTMMIIRMIMTMTMMVVVFASVRLTLEKSLRFACNGESGKKNQ